MQPRMTNAAALVPAALKALQDLNSAAEATGVSPTTVALVQLRASQINGCSVCCDAHARMMKRAGESDDRLFALAAWRDTPYYTEAERAALALTESVTRLADREDPVPDAVWNEAAKHHDERALAGLLLSIAAINVWNRLNAATRQPAGVWKG
jgi:AhpD family alkylhydroperoxidase